MPQCKYCLQDFTLKIKYHKPVKTCGSKRCQQEYKNEWGRLNPKCKQDWILRNPQKRKEVSAKYQKENWPYYVQYSRLYSTNKLKACPKWANKDRIKEIYEDAKSKGLEVDHIIPLTNRLVCGLHVEDNLQLLTRTENAKKNNKFNIGVISKEGVL